MFDITVENPSKKGEHIHVWQNSLGLSTRVIGVMIMIHGDDKGLGLPPRIAKIQAVIIPVGLTAKLGPESRKKLEDKSEEIRNAHKKAGVSADVDFRSGFTPAWKFNDWELRGVPLRLEFGPKDAEREVVSYARRDTGEKDTISLTNLTTEVPKLLETIQTDLYSKAERSFRERRLQISESDKIVPALDSKNVVLIPFCLDGKCEERIKELRLHAPGLCEQPARMTCARHGT